MNFSKVRWFLTGLCWGLTPWVFRLADLERGYNATGGEIFFPMLPLFVWLIVVSIKQDEVLKSD